MNISRSQKGEMIAAFILGGLIALLVATPARSAGLVELDSVPEEVFETL